MNSHWKNRKHVKNLLKLKTFSEYLRNHDWSSAEEFSQTNLYVRIETKHKILLRDVFSLNLYHVVDKAEEGNVSQNNINVTFLLVL